MYFIQPRSQDLSSLPTLVVGTETPVAGGRVTIYPSKTAGWVGTQVHFVEGKFVIVTIKKPWPHPSSRFFYHPDSGWSRDQPQPESLFQRLRDAEKRDPVNEVDMHTLLSELSGFRPSRCTKLFLNSNYSSSNEEIYVIKAISKSHFLGTEKKKITQVKLKCLKFCVHQISANVVHVVGM